MPSITRRGYLAGNLGLAARAPQVSKPAKGPNILWIQTDEQRPDSLGCYGSSWARTPNVDRLAARGATFHECHVQSPICVPSRTSMLSGRYPHELNVYDNTVQNKSGVLDPKLKMFPNVFADAGYRTASLGKYHTPQHPTWRHNVFTGVLKEHVNLFGLARPHSEAEHRVVKRLGGTPIVLGGIYPYHDWGETMSSRLTDMAIDWLKEATRSDQPFLLRVSHIWPHTPVLVPRPWDQLYSPADVPCRAGNRKAYEERAEYDRASARLQRGLDIPLETWRRICAYYYALCAYVDHEVGRLLRTLEQLGLAEDTIVAYNADHGKSLGEAGLCEKGTFDREVWRVPFLISWPGHVPEGEHRRDLMELMDFGATLCALAGIEKAPGMRGRDLFHSAEPEAVFGIIGPAGHRAAVRTRKFRFDCTWVEGGKVLPTDRCDPNLFDLESDPGEEHNLSRDPNMRSVVEEMRERIRRWIEHGAHTA